MTEIPDKWIIRYHQDHTGREAYQGYSSAFSRLLTARGLKEKKDIEAFIRPSLSELYDPFLIPGMQPATEGLKYAIDNGQKILVFGDYDADGIISSALIYNFLKVLGVDVDAYIPDRVSEGYDLGVDIIRSVTGKRDLILCVDCGTNNLDSQQHVLCHEEAPRVIACDHHNPTLNDYTDNSRYIIVNPRLPGSGYPFKDLSGGGVTFKFLIAVLRSLESRVKKRFKKDYLNTLLDLVAISTMADLMPLVDENRTLVKKGLKRMPKTLNHGLKALIDVCISDRSHIMENDVGFVLAPRINAAGRVKEAIDSFRLLSVDDTGDKINIARKLDALNRKRQEQQKKIFEEIITGNNFKENIQGAKIYIDCSSCWNEGVLGIVASDILKEFNIPVILFRDRQGVLKGSGRSIPEFRLHHNLLSLAHLFIRFGGHDLACGITMEKSRFEEFKRKMTAAAGSALSDGDIIKRHRYDMELSFGEIERRFLKEIQMLRPFGKGNPVPSFVTRDCVVRAVKSIKDGRHVKMRLVNGGRSFEGILFNIGPEKGSMLSAGKVLDILYDLTLNSWMGQERIQLVIRDLFQKN